MLTQSWLLIAAVTASPYVFLAASSATPPAPTVDVIEVVGTEDCWCDRRDVQAFSVAMSLIVIVLFVYVLFMWRQANKKIVAYRNFIANRGQGANIPPSRSNSQQNGNHPVKRATGGMDGHDQAMGSYVASSSMAPTEAHASQAKKVDFNAVAHCFDSVNLQALEKELSPLLQSRRIMDEVLAKTAGGQRFDWSSVRDASSLAKAGPLVEAQFAFTFARHHASLAACLCRQLKA